MNFEKVISNLNSNKIKWLPNELNDLIQFNKHLEELKRETSDLLEEYQNKIFAYFPYCSDYSIDTYINYIQTGIEISWSSYVYGNISPDAKLF